MLIVCASVQIDKVAECARIISYRATHLGPVGSRYPPICRMLLFHCNVHSQSTMVPGSFLVFSCRVRVLSPSSTNGHRHHLRRIMGHRGISQLVHQHLLVGIGPSLVHHRIFPCCSQRGIHSIWIMFWIYDHRMLFPCAFHGGIPTPPRRPIPTIDTNHMEVVYDMVDRRAHYQCAGIDILIRQCLGVSLQ